MARRTHVLAALGLALGCRPDLPADPPAHTAPPPAVERTPAPPSLALELPTLLLDHPIDVVVTGSGVAEGQIIRLVVGLNGLGSGPCLAGTGLCLDIVGPVKLVDSAPADASGVATLTTTLPGLLGEGTEIAMQAVLKGPGGAAIGSNAEVGLTVPTVLGCTDPGASNYDPLATVDDGTCAFCDAPRVNAMQTALGAIVPLYPVTDPAADTDAVGFVRDGDFVRALGPDESELWSVELAPGPLFGGFDFDQDGWPDLGVATSTDTGSICGSVPWLETSVSLLQGVDGSLVTSTSPELDICWDFDSVVYPTSQWTWQSVLFGPDSPSLTMTPYYATTSWFFTWDGVFSSEYLFYPSTASYDVSYTADQLNAWGTGTSYLANAHIANGLHATVDGQERAVFFTSGRVVQYAVEPYHTGQLVFDHPFLSGGRTDIAGRNYGLVSRDPSYPDHLALVSGTNAYSVYADMVSGVMGYDEWGQIERHVTLYDMSTNALEDRFFSYAHDAGDGHKYEGRVVYPDTAFMPAEPGSPSRLAYNVYSGGHWYLHISQPGSTADTYALRGVFLWDLRDIDDDGIIDWVTSPTEFPDDPDVPGYYFPKWQINLYHWNEATLTLDPTGVLTDRIPELVASFRQPERTTSMGALYPALTIADGCTPELLTRTSAGLVEAVEL